MATVSTIMEQVLSLPVDDRIGLVERLLLSLNLPTQAEIDRQWAAEAERRIEEIEQGTVRLIPGEQVFENIRRKYAQ
ncbi:addiction module protein [Trichlorobacter lovleyi]|uniref:addiction module protein n=1 Tax=Trichlorobacter lovleyi TaxID=313985 RepID=UPI003D0E65A5